MMNVLVPPSQKAKIAFIVGLVNSAGLALLGSYCLFNSVRHGEPPAPGAAAATAGLGGTLALILA